MPITYYTEEEHQEVTEQLETIQHQIQDLTRSLQRAKQETIRSICAATCSMTARETRKYLFKLHEELRNAR